VTRETRELHIKELCDSAMQRIDSALAGESTTTLSPGDLRSIRSEVQDMRSAMSPKLYKPSFARFILDSYQGGDALTEFLLDLSYQYNQRLK
jgi:hypothetical protein